ncbi:kinase-like protein [Peniophora sp. CONT]|nr:kinase-like protein [Peniophora sp. CONT]
MSSTLRVMPCTINDDITVNGKRLGPMDSQILQDGDIIEFEENALAANIRCLYRKKHVFRCPKSSAMFDVIQTAGQGGFGLVYRCREKHANRAIAIKEAQADVREDMKTRYSQEAHVLRKLWRAADKARRSSGFGGEPQIVRIRDHWISNKLGMSYIAMDLAVGDLFYLTPMLPRDKPVTAPSQARLTENQIASAATDIFNGLTFIHNQKLVHCDIKPNNFLLYDPIDEFTGMRRVEPFHGTPGYLPPEVASPFHVYTTAVDVWAAGLTIYYLFTGISPFKSARADQVQELAYAGDHWQRLETAEGVSAEAVAFLRGCIETDWSKRFTSDDARSHPWIMLPPWLNESLNSTSGSYSPPFAFEDLFGSFNAPAQAFLEEVEDPCPAPAQKRAREQVSDSQPEAGDEKRARN